MPALVLLSGGMDSVIGYYHTLQRARSGNVDGRVHALSFLYGQRHRSEVVKARQIYLTAQTKHLWYEGLIGEHRIVNIPVDGPIALIPRVGSLMTELDVTHYETVEEANNASADSSFIAHRNLLFLTIASMWAHHYGADEIVTGLRGGFPDCTVEFEEAVEACLQIGDGGRAIKITSPVHISRADSLKMAVEIEGCFDALGYSLTCFHGSDPPCGKCLPCQKRAEGFKAAGLVDPILKG